MRIRIGEHEDTVIPDDDAELSARVAWQTRVTRWIDVACANALADFEMRRRRHVAPRRVPPGDHLGDHRRRELRNGLRRTRRRLAALDLRRCNKSGAHELPDHARHPSFVIAHAQVLGRWQNLNPMTRRIEIPLASASPQHASQRIDPRLPGSVKDGLVLLVFDGTHAVHATHVVDAVHAAPPAGDNVTFATPTIESRVTSAVSASSVMFSLPAGRSGRTR